MRWLVALGAILLFIFSVNSHAAAYYINCSASTNGNGSRASPWNQIDPANRIAFKPGDHIRFARNSTCQDDAIFAPQGSGTGAMPIVIDAYGKGTKQPVLSSTAWAVMAMQNQQYWEINNLVLAGGRCFGLWVNNNTANPLNHLYFRGLELDGASSVSMQRAQSGELFISNTGEGGVFNDVLIDHVLAHNTVTSEGIFIQAGASTSAGVQALGNNIVVQNSMVHDVYGDGILVTTASNALLQNNVVYNTGQCTENCGSSTPSGLWEYYCESCIIANNESYSNRTIPYNNGAYGDGGDYDIDAMNTKNIVEYNYGHDSWGYCVMLYSAVNGTDVNNTIRYNVCSNNEQRPNTYYNFNEGEIYVTSAPGSSINGVQIYNNTIYWNPVTPGSPISTEGAIYSGSYPNFVRNNIIYSAAATNLVWTNGPLQFSNNSYWIANGGAPSWAYGVTAHGLYRDEPMPAASYTSLSAYQAATGLDANSLYADPLLNRPTYHRADVSTSAFTLQPGSPALSKGTVISDNGGLDFFGNLVSATAPPNMGAYNGAGITR